jgi:hypothetical protein
MAITKILDKFLCLKKLLLLFYFLDLISSMRAKANEKNQKPMVNELEAVSTIFLSGFLDRSFFITTFMALKYSKFTVLISASLALCLIGVLSVFLGVTLNKYVPP